MEYAADTVCETEQTVKNRHIVAVAILLDLFSIHKLVFSQ